MSGVNLVLFGGFEVLLPSGRHVKLAARKAQALLAYCALRPGSHLRQTLATLLWGESSDDRARNSLRQTLFVLRAGLGERTSEFLRIEADTIATNPAAFDLDVRAFERLAAEGTVQALEQAAALYRGDLLEGLIVEAEVFEQWLMQERERLRDLAIEVLARLFRHHSSNAAPDSAIQTARRLLTLDPLQETVHRALMRLLARSGRREAALQQYDVCAALLKRELRLDPDIETTKLRDDIAGGLLPGSVDPLRLVAQGAPNGARGESAVASAVVHRGSARQRANGLLDFTRCERLILEAQEKRARAVAIRNEALERRARLRLTVRECLENVATYRALTAMHITKFPRALTAMHIAKFPGVPSPPDRLT
jgi:DNA-binding SARP family transcriptional activator